MTTTNCTEEVSVMSILILTICIRSEITRNANTPRNKTGTDSAPRNPSHQFNESHDRHLVGHSDSRSDSTGSDYNYTVHCINQVEGAFRASLRVKNSNRLSRLLSIMDQRLWDVTILCVDTHSRIQYQSSGVVSQQARA